MRALRRVSKQEIEIFFFLWFHNADDTEQAVEIVAGILRSLPGHAEDVKRLRRLISSDHDLLDLLIGEYGEEKLIGRLLTEIKALRSSGSLTDRDPLDLSVPWLIVTLDILLFIYRDRHGGQGISSNPELFKNLLLLQHDLSQSCLDQDFTVHMVIHDSFKIGPTLAWDSALAVLK